LEGVLRDRHSLRCCSGGINVQFMTIDSGGVGQRVLHKMRINYFSARGWFCSSKVFFICGWEEEGRKEEEFEISIKREDAMGFQGVSYRRERMRP
jgi:hypothetical protein